MAANAELPLLSVCMPARDAAAAIGPTLDALATSLAARAIPFEFVVADDGSSDDTAAVVTARMQAGLPTRLIRRAPPHGFGRALRACLAHCRGAVAVVVMPDRSDDPADVVRCYEAILAGNDAAFGSRFLHGSAIAHYPRQKLLWNRLGNRALQLLFRTRCNDLTNSLKAYRREAIAAVGPLCGTHFNVNLELALGVLVRGLRVAQIPVRWDGASWHAARHRVRDLARRHIATAMKTWAEGRMLRDDLLAEHGKTMAGIRGDLDAADTVVSNFEATGMR